MGAVSNPAPRILAVVVTHNGRRWLRSCLNSIASQNYPALEIVVVDNGSATPAADLVKEVLPAAEVFRLDANVGFGAAANLALESSKHAPESDFFLFVHDDVALQSDCTSELVKAAVETEAGVVGGKGVSWDESGVLLEVGMSADQLGYPFTNLEEGEIDQGQHDERREVLYVTSACCLLSRGLVERCGSWDGGYFVFGEDLDLCLRGRISGYKVVVEPAARFLHAVALSSGTREAPGLRPVRFYTRRNRLRTIAKTSATYRMWAIFGLYLLVSVGEIVALMGLRRFEHLSAYPRALGSFFISLPDVVRRRRAVQKRRSLPDRRIRRLMVRDLHRLRVFAERRVRNWEVGTARFGSALATRLSPTRLKEQLLASMRHPSNVAIVFVSLAFLFAARDVLVGEPLGGGGFWPFPESTLQMLREYLIGWREVGLGSPTSAPPALVIHWVAGLLSFGSPQSAQTMLILGLVVAGMFGVYRLVARRTTRRWAPVGAMGLYALGPATQAIVGGGDLGALAMFAGMPFVLRFGLRMLRATPSDGGDIAPVPLTADQMTQYAARLALAVAFMVALGPSSFVAASIMWFFISLFTLSSSWDRPDGFRRAFWVAGSSLAGLVLLLPWTVEALRPHGALLGPLLAGLGGGGSYSALWQEASFSSFLMMGSDSIWLALVVPALALGALLLGPAGRRREVRLLLGIWVVFAAIGGLVAKGWLPAPVASPQMWLVIPLLSLAILGGHLIAGVAEELPAHVLGWRHIATALVSVSLAAGLVLGWGSGLAGWGRPESTVAAATDDFSRSISSFFTSSAVQVGDFRILWLGHEWVDPIRSGYPRRDHTPYLLTGPEGLSALDIYQPSPRRGEAQLEEVIESLVARRLHQAGHLMAPASIRYVVVATDDQQLVAAMRRQRDFGLEDQQANMAIFRNINWLPRAALVPSGLVNVASGESRDDKALMLAEWTGGRSIPRRSAGAFALELPRTYHPSILMGDNFDLGWTATVGSTTLSQARSFGWSSRFEIPEDLRGDLRLTYSRWWIRVALVLLQLAILGLAFAMARLRSSELPGRLR